MGPMSGFPSADTQGHTCVATRAGVPGWSASAFINGIPKVSTIQVSYGAQSHELCLPCRWS